MCGGMTVSTFTLCRSLGSHKTSVRGSNEILTDEQ